MKKVTLDDSNRLFNDSVEQPLRNIKSKINQLKLDDIVVNLDKDKFNRIIIKQLIDKEDLTGELKGYLRDVLKG